jgi:hypothetical protein
VSELESPAEPQWKGGLNPKHPPETIEDLDLPVRPFNLLKREGVNTIAALTSMTEESLLDFRNLGVKDLASIKTALERHGLRLRPVAPEPFTDVIEVEHVTIYRWGGLQVTINGDGSGVISQRELDAQAMQALCEICGQIAHRAALQRLAESSGQEPEGNGDG